MCGAYVCVCVCVCVRTCVCVYTCVRVHVYVLPGAGGFEGRRLPKTEVKLLFP